MSKIFISSEGLEDLGKELEYLNTVKRKEVAKRIKQALEQGDLSENAEYAEAKEEQAFLEGKIIELKEKIKNAEVIKKSAAGKAKEVSLGSKITVKFNGSEAVYQIVGSSEANPSEGKISNESPLGRALMGRKVGEQAEVNAPDGMLVFEIVGIG